MFDRSEFLAILAGATGGAIAIAIMEAFSASTAFPLVAIPFATSIVTVLARLGKSTARATPRVDRRPSDFHARRPARRQALRTCAVGRSTGSRSRNGRDESHWHVSPTGWN